MPAGINQRHRTSKQTKKGNRPRFAGAGALRDALPRKSVASILPGGCGLSTFVHYPAPRTRYAPAVHPAQSASFLPALFAGAFLSRAVIPGRIMRRPWPNLVYGRAYANLHYRVSDGPLSALPGSRVLSAVAQLPRETRLTERGFLRANICLISALWERSG